MDRFKSSSSVGMAQDPEEVRGHERTFSFTSQPKINAKQHRACPDGSELGDSERKRLLRWQMDKAGGACPSFVKFDGQAR